MEKRTKTGQQSHHAEIIREEVLDEIADLEEYARLGKRPPLCRGYRIRINGQRFVVPEPCITGRGVLELAGLKPPENYTVRVKVAGQRQRGIQFGHSLTG